MIQNLLIWLIHHTPSFTDKSLHTHTHTHLALTNHCTHTHTPLSLTNYCACTHLSLTNYTHTQTFHGQIIGHTHTHTHLSLTNHSTHTHFKLKTKQISYSRSGDDVDRSTRIGVGLCTAAIVHLQHRAEQLLPLPSHTRMHAHTHAHTHTHTYMHTHTHICTHTPHSSSDKLELFMGPCPINSRA